MPNQMRFNSNIKPKLASKCFFFWYLEGFLSSSREMSHQGTGDAIQVGSKKTCVQMILVSLEH